MVEQHANGDILVSLIGHCEVRQQVDHLVVELEQALIFKQEYRGSGENLADRPDIKTGMGIDGKVVLNIP
ncbi:hypothetical protein DSECCO2_382920 [anaerobic digester metagenome]